RSLVVLHISKKALSLSPLTGKPLPIAESDMLIDAITGERTGEPVSSAGATVNQPRSVGNGRR
ncbi:hypothetical protein J6590_100262, partial [Homalodisca vitripennis]